MQERQIALETQYSNDGIRDAIEQWKRDLVDGKVANTYIGRRITVQLYDLTRNALEDICTNGSNRGVGAKFRQLLTTVGYDRAAVIALRTTLRILFEPRARDGIVKANLVQDFITVAADTCETEFIVSKTQLAAPGYIFKVIRSLDEPPKTSKLYHRRRTFIKSANNIGLKTEQVTWSREERIGVAKLLLQALVNIGLVVIKPVPKGSGTGQYWYIIEGTPSINEHIDKLVNSLHPFMRFPPMLVPPKPHTVDTIVRGASYLTEGMSYYAGTIRFRTKLKRHIDWVKENISQVALDAANKSASVPYRIDSDVVEILKRLYKEGINNLAGIPSSKPITPPPYPLPDNWDRNDPKLIEIHKAWKIEAKYSYSDEITRKGHVLQFTSLLKYLEDFKDTDIYFPTYYDWRGRLYFKSRINPQSQDFIKASLHFAEKKPLGNRGLYWLKVHVATCYGYDKASFEKRAVWTDKNMEAIRDAAKYHIDSDFFRNCDEGGHWSFYVAARELVKAIDSRKPEEYCTGIPIAMDATCSGSQHLSAVLRDSIGGLYTNLIPNGGDEKEDIYAAVSAVAMTLIQEDKDNPAMARYWVEHGITRAMAKRPVMTYVYGGTLRSCTEYIYMEMRHRGLEPLENYTLLSLAAYASKFIRIGIEKTTPASADCMRFLRSLVYYLPKNVPMQWVTPAGFPVLQHYPKEKIVRVDLKSMGYKLSFNTFDDNEEFVRRCVNGMAPNYTHSMDSSHLVMVIINFSGSIVPIHDSFATHPCDVDEMHSVLRSQFVSMYQNNKPLQVLVDFVKDYTDKEIVLPEPGSLNISKVLESQFFMC